MRSPVAATLACAGCERSRLISRSPSLGTRSTGNRKVAYLGRRPGSQGEIRVRVRTRSGRRAATRVHTAPPSELPNTPPQHHHPPSPTPPPPLPYPPTPHPPP